MPQGVVYYGNGPAIQAVPQDYGHSDHQERGVIRKGTPTGDPIPINVEPKDITGECSDNVDLQDVVKGLHNGRSGGTTGMHAEHTNGWMWGMED